MSDTSCVFCRIVAGTLPASVVADEPHALAIVDLRQFHAGHVIVISRAHVHDIRDADATTVAAVFDLTARVARAVQHAFTPEGLSLWHSAGEAANQEVPHLHVHIHPRRLHDQVLDVYPSPPTLPDRATLDAVRDRVVAALDLPIG
jgi:histidine triad (HIT) family protein